MLVDDSLPFLIVIADYEFAGTKEKWIKVLHSLAQNTWDGRVAVQVRIKGVKEIEHFSLAKEAAGVLGSNYKAILNGKPKTARDLGFWGVHLSQAQLRDSSTTDTGLGFVSAAVHDHDQLAYAQRLGVTALLCSPIFQSAWKAGFPIGLEGLCEFSRKSTVPVYALGGISPSNCASCLDAGAHGIAVLSSILGSEEPTLEIDKYMKACPI